MTTFLMMVILWMAPDLFGRMNPEFRWTLVGLFSVLTIVLPFVSILLLRLTSNLSGFAMEERRERLWPLIFTAVYYGATVYWFAFRLQVSTPMLAILTAIFCTIAAMTIITLFWKISVHSAGAWGGVGILLGILHNSAEFQLVWILLITILLAGLLSSARLYLKAHSFSQVLAGGLAGFTICYFCIYLML